MTIESFNFEQHLQRQRQWSERTFGPGDRTKGVVDHMSKELAEVLEARADYERRRDAHAAGKPAGGYDSRDVLPEWIDLVILALDGAWRCGASPEEIIAVLVAKQDKNEARKWPDWRTAAPDKAIEHDRTNDLPAGIVAELKHVDDFAASIKPCARCEGTGSVEYESPGPNVTRECFVCGGTGVVDLRAT